MKKKTFNLYSDESTHLANDGLPYMLVSYIGSAYNQVKIHSQYIRQIKRKHFFKGELKWTGVSGSMYPFYSEILNYFFATDLQFRAVIVEKSQIDCEKYGYTYNDFYFRMYYQLFYHKLDEKNKYNIYIDIKDTVGGRKINKLYEILNSKSTCIKNMQFIRSHESELLQLADLLMGAINYFLRGENKVTAKNKIIEKIKQQSKSNLKWSTPKYEDKFNLFFIDLE